MTTDELRLLAESALDALQNEAVMEVSPKEFQAIQTAMMDGYSPFPDVLVNGLASLFFESTWDKALREVANAQGLSVPIQRTVQVKVVS
jgi:hypothetical protein